MNKKMAYIIVLCLFPLSFIIPQSYLIVNLTKSPNLLNIDYTKTVVGEEIRTFGSNYSPIIGFNFGGMGYLNNGNNKGFGIKGFLGVIDRTDFNLNTESSIFGKDSHGWTFKNLNFSFGGFYFYKINSIYIQPYGMGQLAFYNLDVTDSDSPGGTVLSFGIDVGVDMHFTTTSLIGVFISIGYNLNLISEATFDIETDVAFVSPGDDPDWIWANHEAKLKTNFLRASFGVTFGFD